MLFSADKTRYLLNSTLEVELTSRKTSKAKRPDLPFIANLHTKILLLSPHKTSLSLSFRERLHRDPASGVEWSVLILFHASCHSESSHWICWISLFRASQQVPAPCPLGVIPLAREIEGGGFLSWWKF